MKRVVVVEDNELVAKYLRYILEHAGYLVKVTESGDEVIVAAQEPETVAVLMDVSLRSTQYAGRYIDGLELARLLKQDDKASRVPVILATARAMAGDRERFLRDSGADGFIRKPIVDPGELLSLIHALG